ncbi:MarR family winged helix-turn-helix transcriptional regulator [Nocardiopsis composta]
MAEKSTEDEGERAGVRGPLADLTAFRLIKLGDLIYAEAQRTLAPLGLTPRLFHVLAGAASMDAPSQQDLARTLGFDPNVMVGVVDELERLGLAERARNPATAAATSWPRPRPAPPGSPRPPRRSARPRTG